MVMKTPLTTKPILTDAMIIDAAWRYRERMDRWPSAMSGDATPDFEFPEVWSSVNTALREGRRGLSGNTTLAKVLDAVRGPRDDLTEQEILEGARMFRARTGRWPS